jgi:hypothetical protein
MKLAIKVLSVMVLLALLSPVILLKGCGEAIDGGQCGGCPDSVAPTGSSITASTLSDGSSYSDGAVCYPTVTFQVFGPDGLSLNNICVELYTDGWSTIGLQTPSTAGTCSTANYSYIRTRTDNHGVVTVSLYISNPCSALASEATSGTFYVWAQSCTATATATAKINILDTGGCP